MPPRKRHAKVGAPAAKTTVEAESDADVDMTDSGDTVGDSAREDSASASIGGLAPATLASASVHANAVEGEPLPSFLLLAGAFDGWPADISRRLRDPRPVRDQIYVSGANADEMDDSKTLVSAFLTANSVWDLEIYTRLELRQAQTNVFLSQFTLEVYQHLPETRKLTVGLVGCSVLAFRDPRSSSRAFVQAFPKVELSVDQLHNFELIIGDLIPPSEKDGMGHFNVWHVPSIVQTDKLDERQSWPILHWDSIGSNYVARCCT